MSKKGVSGIIATILLVMITIALAGTAYVYFSGMVSGRTAKTISLLEVDCNSASIMAVISNDGTVTITPVQDIEVYVDGVEDSTISFSSSTLTSHNSTSITGIDQGVVVGGTYTVLIKSPGNVEKRDVSC